MCRLKIAALLVQFLPMATSLQYELTNLYTPANFFDEFRFFTGSDPTNGFVQYLPFETAEHSGLINNDTDIHLGVDYTNVYPVNGPGRPSVRLESKATFTEGLFVINLSHIPAGCGVWPAFWTVGLGDWPADGEIDIIENVNDETHNNAALHALGECTVDRTVDHSATWKSTDCSIAHDGNQGCGSKFLERTSYGEAFNQNGGGVYALEWTSSAIKIWFFPPEAVPESLSSPDSYLASFHPDPSTFGTPSTSFAGPCSSAFRDKFFNHTLVIDTTFCGGWAGGSFGSGEQSKCIVENGKTPQESCVDFVGNNPAAFTEAYWSIDSLRVWQQVASHERVVHVNATTKDNATVATLATVLNAEAPSVAVEDDSSPEDDEALPLLEDSIKVSPLTGGTLDADELKPFPILKPEIESSASTSKPESEADMLPPGSWNTEGRIDHTGPLLLTSTGELPEDSVVDIESSPPSLPDVKTDIEAFPESMPPASLLGLTGEAETQDQITALDDTLSAGLPFPPGDIPMAASTSNPPRGKLNPEIDGLVHSLDAEILVPGRSRQQVAPGEPLPDGPLIGGSWQDIETLDTTPVLLQEFKPASALVPVQVVDAASSIAAIPVPSEVTGLFNTVQDLAPVAPVAAVTPMDAEISATPLTPLLPLEPVAPIVPLDPSGPIIPAAPVEPAVPVAPLDTSDTRQGVGGLLSFLDDGNRNLLFSLLAPQIMQGMDPTAALDLEKPPSEAGSEVNTEAQNTVVQPEPGVVDALIGTQTKRVKRQRKGNFQGSHQGSRPKGPNPDRALMDEELVAAPVSSKSVSTPPAASRPVAHTPRASARPANSPPRNQPSLSGNSNADEAKLVHIVNILDSLSQDAKRALLSILQSSITRPLAQKLKARSNVDYEGYGRKERKGEKGRKYDSDYQEHKFDGENTNLPLGDYLSIVKAKKDKKKHLSKLIFEHYEGGEWVPPPAGEYDLAETYTPKDNPDYVENLNYDHRRWKRQSAELEEDLAQDADKSEDDSTMGNRLSKETAASNDLKEIAQILKGIYQLLENITENGGDIFKLISLPLGKDADHKDDGMAGQKLQPGVDTSRKFVSYVNDERENPSLEPRQLLVPDIQNPHTGEHLETGTVGGDNAVPSSFEDLITALADLLTDSMPAGADAEAQIADSTAPANETDLGDVDIPEPEDAIAILRPEDISIGFSSPLNETDSGFVDISKSKGATSGVTQEPNPIDIDLSNVKDLYEMPKPGVTGDRFRDAIKVSPAELLEVNGPSTGEGLIDELTVPKL